MGKRTDGRWSQKEERREGRKELTKNKVKREGMEWKEGKRKQGRNYGKVDINGKIG